MELGQKAQVLKGRGILGHFEMGTLGYGIFSGFQEVFSTVEAMFFRQNTCKNGNNAVEMPQAFLDIARFTRFTELNLLNMHSISFNGAYFLLAVVVEGDESSRLKMPN